jgi:hypothetical protein
MKPFLIAACIASFPAWAGAAPVHAGCHATVAASVEVAPGSFSLADLLEPGSCPSMRSAAARVRLGSAPLAGSVRVLDGEQVRTLLRASAEDAAHLDAAPVDADQADANPVDANQVSDVPTSILVPERITVRRAGARASCADIRAQIPGPFDAAARPIDCGGTGRISQTAALEFTRPAWDPALGSWQLYARCVHPADCVPFLVRLRGGEAGAGSGTEAQAEKETGTAASRPRSTIAKLAAASSPSLGQTAPGPAPAGALVRPGQAVTLLWDEDGIRLVVPAVALDAGAPGERVRARIGRGGTLVRATVVSAGMLRAAS